MTRYDSRSTQAYHDLLDQRQARWSNPPHLGVPECGPNDPIFDIGREPVGGGISDASENLDKYLYGPRTLDDALAHAETWRDSKALKGEEYVGLLYDQTVMALTDLVLLANEVLRLRSEVSPLLSERIRKQQVQREVRDFLDKNWAKWSS